MMASPRRAISEEREVAAAKDCVSMAESLGRGMGFSMNVPVGERLTVFVILGQTSDMPLMYCKTSALAIS